MSEPNLSMFKSESESPQGYIQIDRWHQWHLYSYILITLFLFSLLNWFIAIHQIIVREKSMDSWMDWNVSASDSYYRLYGERRASNANSANA